MHNNYDKIINQDYSKKIEKDFPKKIEKDYPKKTKKKKLKRIVLRRVSPENFEKQFDQYSTLDQRKNK